jgi:hypothetical protein
MAKQLVKIGLILAATLAIVACGASLSDIKESPAEYTDGGVEVSGTVQSTLRVPFTDITVFYFSDGETTIPVVGAEARNRGDEITLTGTLVEYDGSTDDETVAAVTETLQEFVRNSTDVDEDDVVAVSEDIYVHIRKFIITQNENYFVLAD